MRQLVFICLICLFQSSYAQNLLLNGDFEDVRCLELFENPQTYDALTADNWFNLTRPYSTCDVFSVCNTIPYALGNDSIAYYTTWGVPHNLRNYQWPQNGETYMGFGFCRNMNFENPNYSYEYPLGILSESLDKDSLYCVDLFTVSSYTDTLPLIPQAEEKYYHVVAQFLQGFFLKEFQYRFTRKIMDVTDRIFLYNSDSSFLASKEWIPVQSPYKASGGERFFALGLTLSNAEMYPHVQEITNLTEEDKRYLEEVNLWPSGGYGVGGWVYYFADNISITPIPALNANADKSVVLKGAPLWLSTGTAASNLQWYTQDGPVGQGDSVLVFPTKSQYYYLKGQQCRYTQFDSVWVEVEEVLPVPITLNVYQNLNQGTVQFEYLGDVRPTLQVAVYNLAGQRVQGFPLSESSSVSFNNLAAGMYIIDARLEGIPVKTAKVVVGR